MLSVSLSPLSLRYPIDAVPLRARLGRVKTRARAAATINIRKSEITLRERKSPLCSSEPKEEEEEEERYVYHGSDCKGPPTDRPSGKGGQWHIFVQTVSRLPWNFCQHSGEGGDRTRERGWRQSLTKG